MITAKVSYRENTKRFRLEIDGHAGQATHGNDVVCSAVSILSFTASQIIQSMYASGRYFPIEPTTEFVSGNAIIDAKCYGEREYEEMRTAMTFLTAGFALLQNEHPEYVKFIIDEA